MSLLGEARRSQDPPKSRPKFFKLGPCWHIFHSWATLFHSWLVLERFLHFFCSCWSFWFELWVAPDSILGGLGQVLEPSKPHLTMFFGVSKHASRKCSSSTNTTQFLRCFINFRTCRTQLQNVFFAQLSMLFWTWCNDCCKKSLLAFTFCFS